MIKIIEPIMDEVIDNLISYNNRLPEKVPIKIYKYLNENSESFESHQLHKLRSNKIIWINNSLWYPKHVFIEDQTEIFGPSGWLRLYLVYDHIVQFSDLWGLLGIDTAPRKVGSWVDWILDFSDVVKDNALTTWQINLAQNALETIASNAVYLSDTQITKLSENKSILSLASGSHSSICPL